MPDYASLTPEQADAYIARFMAEMDASRQRLADALERQGVDPALARDFTPGSLDAIWAPLIPLLEWQGRYQAPQPPHRPAAVSPLDGLGDLDALPSWFTADGGHGLQRFSPTTLWVIDGVARHLGNVLAVEHGWAWQVGHGPTAGFAYENQPVVAGGGDLWSPLMTTAVLVGRHLNGSEHASSPRATHDVWLNPPAWPWRPRAS
ncbi:hypothetical protein [Nocardioides sp. SYSU D00065]|uniref:hypothetical protein n=1 Tax=Nocardioides sp. SYSU D00065 TaxID=2817378 RepID=UPI001B326091|nr:hypothetical protein [Nocardioides sp. SYSU D00065]